MKTGSSIMVRAIAILAVLSSNQGVAAEATRATLGDSVESPAWADQLTVTVGPEKADIIGTSEKPIQGAIEYVTRLGGGTVRILPGTYRLRNAVHLKPRVKLIGSGADTVLIKEPSATSSLAADSDWFDQEITLADPAGFQIGDGVFLRTKVGGAGNVEIAKRTLVARAGNRFKLDAGLRNNFWRLGETKVSTLFSILSGEGIEDIVIENLVLDGNRSQNENIGGDYAACAFFQECNRVAIRGVVARNFNGDGFSWQICHDVLIENCTSEGHANLGMHPGSGSQRSVIRGNRVVGNSIGIFFCWGVRNGIAEGNHVEDNDTGISIGHHDTDNIVRANEVIGSKKVGLLFRPERGKDFTGNRNRIENNRFVDNGSDQGFAIDIQGATRSIQFAGNKIVETRGGARTAIRVGADTGDIRFEHNQFQGFATEVDASAPTTNPVSQLDKK